MDRGTFSYLGEAVGPAMTAWILTDGKIGDRVQCAGIAAGVGGEVTEKTVRPNGLFEWLAPFGPINPSDAPERPGSVIAPPFPNILIASGRRAVPYARAVKTKSGGDVFVVLLKDPRVTAGFADLIWTPRHDRREGQNVFTTLTAPHGLAAKIASAAANPAPSIAVLQKPMLGVVLGGPSGGARYDEASAVALADEVKAAMKGFASLAITPSRRTPPEFLAAFRSVLDGAASFFWEGEGDNPYADILGNAASLIVAADSHNMMSEAAATTAGVYAWRPDGVARKLDWFVGQMEEIGRVRPFAGDAAPFKAEPIDATAEIVAEIKRRLSDR